MVTHTATTPAFVRTDAGVVQVAEGQQLPDDTLPTEITRLVAGGVVEEVSTPTAPDTDAAEPSTARRGRGQSGTTQKG